MPKLRKPKSIAFLKSGDWNHGLPFDEVTSPDAEPGVGSYHYEVDPLPTRDYAAEALKVAQDKYFRTYPDANPESTLWRLRKVEDK